MSHFKDYLRADVLTSLFEKAFLSGKHSRALSVTVFASLGIFWIAKKTVSGVYSLVLAPWNTEADKTYRSLKKVAEEVRASGKTIDSIQKNMDWMNDRWHSLSFHNTNGRSRISGVLFLVHTKSGQMRIFTYPELGEPLELIWGDLHRLVGISGGCDLKIENLSDIYHKMYLNLL